MFAPGVQPALPEARGDKKPRLASLCPSLVAEEMQERIVEQAWILKEREMACVGENEQPGTGNGCGDIFRTLTLYGLVVVAIGNKHRGVD